MLKIFHIIPFICLCIFPVAGAEVSSEVAAAGFIEKLVNDALGIVNHSGMSEDEKRKGLSECVNKDLDIDRITQAVFAPLGYKDLSDEDKEKVKEFMKKYLVDFYAGEGKLSAMVNAKLSGKLVAAPKEKDFSVKTNFKKDSSSVEIVWITDGQRVYYVEIAGFNQITTLRSEMKSAVGTGTLMEYINKRSAK